MGDETVTLTFASEPEPERPIMSARAAMRQAIERAELGEFEGAQLWLNIATELRQGEWMSASAKGIELTDSPTQGRPRGGRVMHYWPRGGGEFLCGADSGFRTTDRMSVTCQSCAHMLITKRFTEERADETVILNTPMVCAHCDFAIGVVTPAFGSPTFWAHLTTRQRVCPGTPKPGGHTYATPKVHAHG